MTHPKHQIAFLKAQWHSEIVDQCKNAFLENLPADFSVKIFEVPGSLEIPLLAQSLAKTGDYKAICCAGFVVDGGIYRHEFVAQAILHGLMQVQLKTEIPVLSAVLTPKETFAEDDSNPEQYKFFYNHMTLKGQELAVACQKTVVLHEK